ncbi:hypothetical protein [Kangiella sp.]|uniref:hypothetical protein n=1 Tax=Kangiella sp. TaxID=1920245 RepID=UPI003A8E4594
MIKKTAVIIISLFLLTACVDEPPYSEKISECITEAHEAYKKTFQINFTSNPVQECFDKNVIGDSFSPLVIASGNKKIDLSTIKKPIYLHTFSDSLGQSLREKEYINDMAVKYSDDIKFIVLHKQAPFASGMMEEKFPKLYGPFNNNITVISVTEDNTTDLDDGYGELISGVRNISYPTTYYLSTDKKIVKVTSLEEVMVQTNIIYMDNNQHLSDQELSKLSFYARVPKLIDELISKEEKNPKDTQATE